MPYIKKEERKHFDFLLNTFGPIEDRQQLEYCIYKLMKVYMNKKLHSYNELHNTVYAAQHCADEFRRNYLDKREDVAREANGDVEPKIQGDF